MRSAKEAPAHYAVLWEIMADPGLSAAAKCCATVLLLKYRNHITGQCNPGFGTLSKMVGRTRRPVIAALNELKDVGWIKWTGTKGGSSANTNNFVFFMERQPVSSTAPVPRTAPVLPTTRRGAADSAQGVLQTAHELSKNHLEPLRELTPKGEGAVATPSPAPRVPPAGARLKPIAQSVPRTFKNRGEYEQRLAELISETGSDGWEVLMGLDEVKVQALCRRLKNGVLTQIEIAELCAPRRQQRGLA